MTHGNVRSSVFARATVGAMDEARQRVTEKVVERLRRIRELGEGGPPTLLLEELRKLVGEAEQWARLEGDQRTRAAVADLEGALRRSGS